MANTLKSIHVFFESAVKTYEHQFRLAEMIPTDEPDPALLQNSNNAYYYPVQQHRPVKTGWDSSKDTDGLLEQGCLFSLGTPRYDQIQQRIDNLRDDRFWKRAGRQSAMRLASEQNFQIAKAIAEQGTIFYDTNAKSAHVALSQADRILDERQISHDKRVMLLNNTAVTTYAQELSNRDLLGANRSEMAYAKNKIGDNVAGFDVYSANFLPNLSGAASPSATISAAQVVKPLAGSVESSTGQITYNDYREAVIPISSTTSWNVGDKLTISNTTGTPTGTIKAVSLTNKQDTGTAMTFAVKSKTATTMTLSPRPIALDDTNLSTLEKSFANVNTTIKASATLTRLNTSSKKTNIFFDMDAVRVTVGAIPSEMFAQYNSAKPLVETLKNGQKLYLLYDGDIGTMNFRHKLFMWWGVNVPAPHACGVFTQS